MDSELSQRVGLALALGAKWAAGPWCLEPPSGRRFVRYVAVGDPQASFERYLRILDRHELLGEDGRLRPDVSLLSIGDHFDYEGDLERVQEDGLFLLRWLAGHPVDQTYILAGNHDVCRVVELAGETDERFARARHAARRVNELRKRGEAPDELREARARFAEEFSEIPTTKVANRDWGSFTVAQRGLVQSLLLDGRLRLAKVGLLADGRPSLLTHAGVTHHDLDALDVPRTASAGAIAQAFEQRLERAIVRVRQDWLEGRTAALDLDPIYVPGASGHEGGGVLYHRPAHPQSMAREGERAPRAPRRFDPRTLPVGLLQVCGHAGHRKCAEDLGEWVSADARSVERGGLRTLRTDGTSVVYEMGIHPVRPDEAGLLMIDGEMNRVPVADYPVLDLEGWVESA